MKKVSIVIIVLILIGIGVWFLFSGEKENGEKNIVLTNEELSLTDILGKVENITSFKYDMVMTVSGEKAITTKMWRKGNNIRTETTVDGREMIYLMNMDKQLAYMYLPSENTAMKMDLSETQEAIGESPTESSKSIMDYAPKTVGTEVLDGKTCLVVKYTTATEETKMWFWTKYGFPIKTEITTGERIVVTEIKNIEFSDISDNMFELPTGVQIMTIPSFGF